MNLFTAEHITKRFAAHTALDKVSIEVPKGCVYGLLGPNGAGKTTLIRIINQIIGPDEGRLFFNGQPLAPDHIHQIGYLPEERGLYKKMKVGEQALYLAQLKGMSRKKAQENLMYWFEKFEIVSWWNRKVEELSKGMQQKIQFIITIIHQPILLIFDEPFSGFDPINQEILKDEILALKDAGSTIIFSTHNMASVEEICDHIALINKSHKLLEGKVKDIKSSHRSNTYILHFSHFNHEWLKILPSGFQLIDSQVMDGEGQVTLKIPITETPNALLSWAFQYAQIHSFNEVLPTMNDIFIETVQMANQNSSVKKMEGMLYE